MTPIMIVGGSVRAAAQSARRAGASPICIDAFGDADLAACGPVVRVTDYPAGIVAATEQFPASHWLYTGALENQPDIIERLSSRHRLWGNPPASLSIVRTQETLVERLAEEQIQTPRCIWSSDGLRSLKPSQIYLKKPRLSGGGQQISWYQATTASYKNRTPSSDPHDPNWYWQKYVYGFSMGAVFIAANGKATLWGITHPLFGRKWPTGTVVLPPEPIIEGQRADVDYAGSIGPVKLAAWIQMEIEHIGQTIARLGKLLGIFGVDLVIEPGAKRIYVIEVNPRWTASVEILERATGLNAFQLHRAACETGTIPAKISPPAGTTWWTQHGKLVVYSDEPWTISPATSEQWLADADDNHWPNIADIPRPGELIPAGAPICTVFARGQSLKDVIHDLIKFQKKVMRASIRWE